MDSCEETCDTVLMARGNVCELSATVKRAIGKIEAAQLVRARQEVADRLKDILEKVNFALNSARCDQHQMRNVSFASEEKEREWLTDAITKFATSTSIKEEILKFILQWLSDSSR